MNWFKRLLSKSAEAIGEAEDVIHRPLYPTGSHWREVSKGKLYRGSWPNDFLFSQMVGLGARIVINLCSERSNDADVRAYGMEPYNIPIEDNSAPNQHQLADFLTCVKLGIGPIFVHCEQGKGRTGCMIAAYRVHVQGWAPHVALAEAVNLGLCLPSQKEFILNLR